MSRNLWSVIVVLAVVALLPLQADAQPILLQRCAADNLDPTQAAARLEWARRCGLVRNVGSPANGFDTGLPALNGGNLIDYAEADYNSNPDAPNVYSGSLYGFEVNHAFVSALYLTGGTSQSTDGMGYMKWARDPSRKRSRPLYPTFGTTANLADANNVQLYRHPWDQNDCRLFANANGTTPIATHYVNGYCESSCYTPDQQILFEGGYVSILDALNARREDLMTLASNSTLDAIALTKNETYGYTVETRDTKHEILVITTASGGELRVTSDHPVINGEGRMVQAQTLKMGDDLVRADGTPDRIVRVKKTSHFGKVYNIRPVTENLVSNVLVAQGFLVGSSRFQNDDVGYINRVILYRSVPGSAIP